MVAAVWAVKIEMDFNLLQAHWSSPNPISHQSGQKCLSLAGSHFLLQGDDITWLENSGKKRNVQAAGPWRLLTAYFFGCAGS